MVMKDYNPHDAHTVLHSGDPRVVLMERLELTLSAIVAGQWLHVLDNCNCQSGRLERAYNACHELLRSQFEIRRSDSARGRPPFEPEGAVRHIAAITPGKINLRPVPRQETRYEGD